MVVLRGLVCGRASPQLPPKETSVTTTITRIRKPATRVELSLKEMELLDRLISDGLVAVIREMKSYKDTDVHNAFYDEAREERGRLDAIRKKFEFATMQIRMGID